MEAFLDGKNGDGPDSRSPVGVTVGVGVATAGIDAGVG